MSSKEISLSNDVIKSKIHTLRGKQVILDRDLAKLYDIKPFRLREQVKRNNKRFPEDFYFPLNSKEVEVMVSQNAIPSIMHLGGHMPYAFTEQGVAMLSGIINSKKAIDININIMRAFVAMRNFLIKNAEIFTRLDKVERKQIEYQLKTDGNFNKIFNAIERKQLTPNYGLFYENQLYDAFKFVVDLIKQARKEIILIDNFIDESVLTLLSNKNKDVVAVIYTANLSEKLMLAKHKFNKQYSKLEIKEFTKSHDRFLIIDNKTYHIGASLKDLGKKWFAFSRLELNILDKLKK
jgi:hypothetical protein